jgi:hypothetical protein
MDVNRLINMFMGIFMKKIVNLAVNKGVEYAASRGKREADMTDAERAQAQAGRDMAGRTKQIRNATRRFF